MKGSIEMHIGMPLEKEMRLIDEVHIALFDYSAEDLAFCFREGFSEGEEYGLSLRSQRGLIRDYMKTTSPEFQRECLGHFDDDMLRVLSW